ncbi:hypothetical protein [Thermococcus sp.]
MTKSSLRLVLAGSFFVLSIFIVSIMVSFKVAIITLVPTLFVALFFEYRKQHLEAIICSSLTWLTINLGTYHYFDEMTFKGIILIIAGSIFWAISGITMQRARL